MPLANQRIPSIASVRPPATRKIDAEQLDMLRSFKEESGMSIDEQLRTAIKDFIDVYVRSWREWNETRVKSSQVDNFRAQVPPPRGTQKIRRL